MKEKKKKEERKKRRRREINFCKEILFLIHRVRDSPLASKSACAAETSRPGTYGPNGHERIITDLWHLR